MYNSCVTLLDSNHYQVFLFCCPANIPFNFAMHFWFVYNEKGKISRWETLFRKRCKNHLFVNFFPPFSGVGVWPFFDKWTWKAKLIYKTEGKLAKQMIDFIKTSQRKYPYCYQYFSLGPNSNTYIQWVLNHFPAFKAKLPWNAFGKNYKRGPG